ncbi:MAG: hypothetical protein C4529_00975 [Deltaproteobacteria bacterium]|nr:MAG: hypothetical protein C4529_00975 [Deltaproteobacteria bacterium]
MTGMRLTYLAIFLAAVSLAGAGVVASTGDLRFPPAAEARGTDAATPDPGRVSAEIRLAEAASEAGDIPAALAHYRAAALHDPRVVDPRSPFFLGPGFEARLKKWIAAQKTVGAGDAQARADAAYLFRRMYGGCG